jgi:hypothetical protein
MRKRARTGARRTAAVTPRGHGRLASGHRRASSRAVYKTCNGLQLTSVLGWSSVSAAGVVVPENEHIVSEVRECAAWWH